MSKSRVMLLDLTEFRPFSESKEAYHDHLEQDLPTLVSNSVFDRLPIHKDLEGSL
jgi:hypothetical protein